MEEDLSVLSMVSQAIHDIYNGVQTLNDESEAKGEDRTLVMPHLRIEGHTTQTAKSTERKSMKTSQERAERIAKAITDNGVPSRFIHAQGFGFSQPIGTADQNRRVEIHVMTPDELDDYIEFFFNKYDRDGSGYLGEPEIKALGKRMGKTKDEILYQLVMMDDEYVPGGEVAIELDELQVWFKSNKVLDKEEMIRRDNVIAQKKLDKERSLEALPHPKLMKAPTMRSVLMTGPRADSGLSASASAPGLSSSS